MNDIVKNEGCYLYIDNGIRDGVLYMYNMEWLYMYIYQGMKLYGYLCISLVMYTMV